jgi:hypothetical protein
LNQVERIFERPEFEYGRVTAERHRYRIDQKLGLHSHNTFVRVVLER